MYTTVICLNKLTDQRCKILCSSSLAYITGHKCRFQKGSRDMLHRFHSCKRIQWHPSWYWASKVILAVVTRFSFGVFQLRDIWGFSSFVGISLQGSDFMWDPALSLASFSKGKINLVSTRKHRYLPALSSWCNSITNTEKFFARSDELPPHHVSKPVAAWPMSQKKKPHQATNIPSIQEQTVQAIAYDTLSLHQKQEFNTFTHPHRCCACEKWFLRPRDETMTA